jgi:hypothetical protein
VNEFTASNIIDMNPAIIAKKWRRVGNRVRARVSNLVAAHHGKKHLREGTAERLRKEILIDLEWLAMSKTAHSDPPEFRGLSIILKNVLQNQRFWKKEHFKESIIQELTKIPDTNTNIEFILKFLQSIHIKQDQVESIIANPSYTTS